MKFKINALAFILFCPALCYASTPCDGPFTNIFSHILTPPEWARKSATATELFRMADQEHWRLTLASDATSRITLYSPEWGPNARFSSGVFYSHLVSFQSNSQKADDPFKPLSTVSTVRIQFPKEGDLHDVEIVIEFKTETDQSPIVTIEYRHRGQERKPKLRVTTDDRSFYNFLFSLVDENATRLIQDPTLFDSRLMGLLTHISVQWIIHKDYTLFGNPYEDKTTIGFREGLSALFPDSWLLLISN